MRIIGAAVEGEARNLHPILRDEIYRIAAESLRSAFQHAQARKIEVEIHSSSSVPASTSPHRQLTSNQCGAFPHARQAIVPVAGLMGKHSDMTCSVSRNI